MIAVRFHIFQTGVDTFSIFIWNDPAGALTSTMSPAFFPINAAPIGELQEIFPSSRFIS